MDITNTVENERYLTWLNRNKYRLTTSNQIQMNIRYMGYIGTRAEEYKKTTTKKDRTMRADFDKYLASMPIAINIEINT